MKEVKSTPVLEPVPFAARVRNWLSNTLLPGGMILTYHRITGADWNPHNTIVTPTHFREHLEVLQRLGRPFPLDELIARSLAGRPPKGGFAITFDDGYRDNLEIAKPILEEFGFPATIFVPTAQLETDGRYYWDELADLILASPVLPETLTISVGEPRSWPVDQTLEGRRAVYLRIARTVDAMNPGERQAALGELYSQIEVNSKDPFKRPTLSYEELAGIEADGLLRIEAHTVNHPSLPRLTPSEQHREMLEGKRTLEAILGRSLEGIAYPYGHYDAVSLRSAREAGFRWAVTAAGMPLTSRADPYEVPRYIIYDIDGDHFEHLVRGDVFGLGGGGGSRWLVRKLAEKGRERIHGPARSRRPL